MSTDHTTDHPTDTDIIHRHQYQGTTTILRDGKEVRQVSLHVQCSCGHREPTGHRQGRRTHASHVAERLTAARMVGTVAELDALPDWTIIFAARAENLVCQRDGYDEDRSWFATGDGFPVSRKELANAMPFRILHLGSEDPS